MKKPLKWEVIAAQIHAETDPLNDELPFGFSPRVVAAWRVAQRDEGLRRWTRWSLRAALGLVAVCALLVAFGSPDDEAPILLQPPSASFVTPTFLNQ